MMGEQRLRALRGATRCLNEEEDIAAQVVALYDALCERNHLREEQILSIFFSMTADLDVKNPAAALRQSGRAGDSALFVVQEAAVRGGLDRTIRLLIHCYLDEGAPPRHVYRNGAEALRPDRSEVPPGDSEQA